MVMVRMAVWGRPFMSGSNAYSATMLNENNAEGNAINAMGFAELRFLKDFKFTWTSSVNVDENSLYSFYQPYYGQYASQNGMLYKYHTRNLAYNHQQLLNWKRSFGSHNLDVMLGHESYRYKYYYLYASKSNMFDPTNHELAGAITENGNNSYTTDYNTEGYFGRVQYDYNEKYFLSGSYRVMLLHASIQIIVGVISGPPVLHGLFPKRTSSMCPGLTY
mgnify:FL=1